MRRASVESAADEDGGALAAVRAATASVHAESEGRLLDTEPFASIGRYRSLLEVLGGWELSVRTGLAVASGDADDLRRLDDRAELLRRDLRTLVGRAGDPRAEGSVAVPVVPFPVEGEVAVLGARYVVEGSRAGGRVLASRLRRSLGADVPAGFLNDGGADAEGRRLAWQRAAAALEALPSADAGPASATALRAFRLIDHFLEAI